jgi:hypothetical protein
VNANGRGEFLPLALAEMGVIAPPWKERRITLSLLMAKMDWATLAYFLDCL